MTQYTQTEGPKRVAIYARYSSDLQTDTSIEDQIRICQTRAEAEGWQVVECYTDHAISGENLFRPGIQALLSAAPMGKFDLVVSEALDRISRDQEGAAKVFKQLRFNDQQIFTLSEGIINELHIGFSGTMGAMFLKELANKTRRGLQGRALKGKSAGGIVYGYDVAHEAGPNGLIERGGRKINEAQAKVVQRIFKAYANGESPAALAKTLNAEKVPAPNGGTWGPSTIYGNRERGTGILNNELYIGRQIWNRLRYIKNPETGKRVSRLNPEDQWVITEVPDLRIIDQDLWDRVKIQQGVYNKKDKPLHIRNRPSYLLSHLVKCGCCGGGFAMHNKTHLSCSTAKNKGTCSNKLTIKREDLETKVLHALNANLMDERLVEAFCQEYTKRMNELRREQNAARTSFVKEQGKLTREKDKIVQSICDGVPAEMLKDRAVFINDRLKELETLLTAQPEEKVIFHPNMSARYKQEVSHLMATLNTPERRAEASQHLRAMIDKVVLTPNIAGEELTIDLIGDLAGILSVATSSESARVAAELSKLQQVHQELSARTTKAPEGALMSCSTSQVELVAGVGFEPTTFRL
ncbi:recombinase family protein [Phaeobacter inhibens]|uniref:recombinase family protein n=1 Tax=Phaeobacter inhibens TaxID=221822 RepID=UPI0021A610FC|nr:recombinase family protein [Phaeobacter inhibens]UWR90346.1 recombinase family protein [Phaeobacter inhibens]